MEINLDKWKAQLRRGYLELCILLLIARRETLYGLELIETLASFGLAIKEGTIYPLLNRMADEELLQTWWKTDDNRGHPRKLYRLTERGQQALSVMLAEYQNFNHILRQIDPERSAS